MGAKVTTHHATAGRDLCVRFVLNLDRIVVQLLVWVVFVLLLAPNKIVAVGKQEERMGQFVKCVKTSFAYVTWAHRRRRAGAGAHPTHAWVRTTDILGRRQGQ